MVLLGKTYAGLMVDVRATNAKLRARAAAVVAAVVGVPADEAHALLRQAGDDASTAILIGRTGLSAEAARRRLARHHNILRAALEAEFDADEAGAL
jgi:N-acetylmuramic acid 6-phosphate etherase